MHDTDRTRGCTSGKHGLSLPKIAKREGGRSVGTYRYDLVLIIAVMGWGGVLHHGVQDAVIACVDIVCIHACLWL